jgi:DNA adenine methylase
MNDKIEKPFLKWVGGKTQILSELLSRFPKEMNNYHEIFVGGGSVLFGLLSLVEQGKITVKGKIFAYDVNPNLIHVYKHLQSSMSELYEHLQSIMNDYNSLSSISNNGAKIIRKPENIEEAMTSKESYYYWMRQQFNTTDKRSVQCAAIFLFLNKTCFRGMYREGHRGYNVPYGHYKKTPGLASKAQFQKWSTIMKQVEFRQCGFSESLKMVQKGDFVYLDPPYAPENPKSFVNYVANGFDLQMHQSLFEQVKNLTDVKFLMSNAKVDFVMNSFPNYHTLDVTSRRSIHAKDPGRTTTEVLIYN